MNIIKSIYQPFFNQELSSDNVISTSVQLNLLEKFKGIYARIFGTNDPFLPKHHAFQHIKLQKLVNLLVKECDIKKDITARIEYSSYAPASAAGNYIWINPLFLLDWNALPDRLKISGIDDPKLQKKEFYKDFFNYISHEFQMYIPQEISGMDIFCLLLFIQLKNDPKQYYSAIRTMIAHELGHIHHEHSLSKSSMVEAIRAFSDRWPTICTLFSPILFIISIISEISHTRSQETQADRFAAELLKDAAIGADYGFSNAKKAIQVLKNCRALTSSERILTRLTMPCNEGFILQLFTHGSFTGRMNYIRDMNQKAQG